MLLKRLASRSALSDPVVLCNLCESIRRTLHTCRNITLLAHCKLSIQSVCTLRAHYLTCQNVRARSNRFLLLPDL